MTEYSLESKKNSIQYHWKRISSLISDRTKEFFLNQNGICFVGKIFQLRIQLHHWSRVFDIDFNNTKYQFVKNQLKIKLQTNIPMGHLCRVDWIIGFIQQKHPLLNNCHFCPVIVSNSILSSFSPLFYYCHGPWMTIAIVFVRFSSLFPFSAFFYVISVVAPNSFCLFDSFVNQIPNETKERWFND